MQAEQIAAFPQGGRSGIKRLVATRVATLPDGTYTDPGQIGLQLRVRSRRDGKATRTWLLRIKFRGEETRLVLGHFPETSLDTARGNAREAREAASRGIDPRHAKPRRRVARQAQPLSVVPATPAAKHSIENLVAEFTTNVLHGMVKRKTADGKTAWRPARKKPEYAEAILKREILPTWEGRDARSIQASEVRTLLRKIAARAPVMANRVSAVLAQLFDFGIDEEIVTASPVLRRRPPGGIELPRERVMLDDELRLFLINLETVCVRNPRTAVVLRILLLTAVRVGELTQARWTDFDFDAKRWELPAEHTKTERDCVVPLTDDAIAAFRELKKHANGSRYVFPEENGKEPAKAKLITRSVARTLKAFKAAGVAAFTPHDLRRSVRTGLARIGVVEHIAERCLNHKQQGIAAVYNRYDYESEKRDALNQWAAHLRGLNQEKTDQHA